MWNDEKIFDSDLKGTQMENDIKIMHKNWCRNAEKYVSQLNKNIDGDINDDIDFKYVSESEWIWARATLQARGFSFRKEKSLINLNYHNDSVDVANNNILDQENFITNIKMREGEKEEEEEDKVDVVSFIPFTTLSNHDDYIGGKTTMGDGVVHPHTSYTFQTNKKVEKNNQVFNYYGELSFQQKFLSFGWVDRFPMLSPEGFCITAFIIPIGSLQNDENDLEKSKKTGDSDMMEIEIKSNILFASEIASRKRIKNDNVGKKSNLNEQEIVSNDISLKITILKFEIRNKIRKIEERGLKKAEIISVFIHQLIEKQKSLIDGGNIREINKNSDRNNDNIGEINDNSDSNSNDSSLNDTNNNAQEKKQNNLIESTQKTKGKQKTKVKGHIKKNSVLNNNSKSLSITETETENENERESDGQYIRRTELEAVELLLAYLPFC